jgi:hypothetical protein
MAAPTRGILLKDMAEGSLVKLNENGSPVEFYVAKHDYESGLNGAGRTLLVRMDCCSGIKWGVSGAGNGYDGCNLDVWLNETYKSTLSEDMVKMVGTTSFYGTPESGAISAKVQPMNRAIFALSGAELGSTSTSINVEGTKLPTASLLSVAYGKSSFGGDRTKCNQWTRSPAKSPLGSTSYAFYIGTEGDGEGGVAGVTVSSGLYHSRPCFTLPANALFDEETLEFKGVA